MPEKRITRRDAREMFRRGCEAYLRLFCDKHGYDYEDAAQSWVAGDVGDVVCVGDMYVDLEDIRTDIDRDAPEDEFVKWYDYGMRLASIDLSIPTPNYSSWLRGYPRRSEQEMAELELLHHKVEVAKAELENAIKNDKKEF